MTAEQLEDYLERAAILEFEAGMPRKQAELIAKRLILKDKSKKSEKKVKKLFTFTM